MLSCTQSLAYCDSVQEHKIASRAATSICDRTFAELYMLSRVRLFPSGAEADAMLLTDRPSATGIDTTYSCVSTR